MVLVPRRIVVHDIPGAGFELFADVSKTVDCVEYVLSAGEQPVLTPVNASQRIKLGYEPWIQFPPQEWTDMQRKLFEEMAEAWNDKYATPKGTQDD